MFENIKLWWTNFCHKFFYSKKEYDMALLIANSRCESALSTRDEEHKRITGILRDKIDLMTKEHIFEKDVLRDEIAKVQAEYDQIRADLTKAHHEYEELLNQFDSYKDDVEEKLDEVNNLKVHIEDLTTENARLKEAPELHSEYLREVQKQLAEAFENNYLFGFPRSVALPGSVSMSTGIEGFGNDTTVCRGRVILDDKTTQAINKGKTFHDKLETIVTYLYRYGILANIAKHMIYNGAVSMTLAYREATTTYEMFYQIAASSCKQDAILVFDAETGLQVEKPEEDMGEKEEESTEGDA